MENNMVNNQPIEQQTKSGSFTLWVVVAVVLVVLMAIAGIYWYMTNKNMAGSQSNDQVQTQQALDTIDQEVSSLDLGDVDSDLSDIDKDLQNL